MEELLNALGYVGDALDKPGRAVRGALAGRGNEALAAIPFSDTLGLTDPANRASGKDVLNSFGIDTGSGLGGDIAGFGTEIATDPLSWIGVGAGARLGRAAEKAAVARGPQWGTTADDLARMVQEFKASGVAPEMADQAAIRADFLMRSPQAMAEIPEGASIIGAGAEGMAFAGPGGVTRIGRDAAGFTGRPIHDAVLQASRTREIPLNAATSIRSEVLPKALGVGDTSFWRARNPETMMSPMDELDRSLMGSGLRLDDRHLGNVGMVGDRPVVIDPGALGYNISQQVPTQPVTQAAQPGMAMNALLDALGSNDAIRAGIDPRYRMQLGLAGGGIGSMAGAAGRIGQ